MTERALNGDKYLAEHANRLASLGKRACFERITPEDVVRGSIDESIFFGNPLVREEDPFVVMGNDGSDTSWFPSASFSSVDEASDYVKQMRDLESEYFQGELAITFHLFTSEGVQVTQTPGQEK